LNAVGVLKSAAILFIRQDTFVDRFMAENGAYIYVKSQIKKNAHRNITFGISETSINIRYGVKAWVTWQWLLVEGGIAKGI
jgi:hypothetical protein